MVPRFGGYRMCCDDRHHASTGCVGRHRYRFHGRGQVDLTDVAPSGAKQSFAPAAESFSMAVNEQRDSAMRMRVMDGVLKALRMRINGVRKLARPYPSLRDAGNSPSRR